MENYRKGFPFLKIISPATVGNGIERPDETKIKEAIETAEKYGGSVVKFVPASGAASRMFKGLFEGLELIEKGDVPEKDSVAGMFISNAAKFPFFDPENILKLTLFGKGLGYSAMPKGLVEFHKYQSGNRTPFEEHMVEGAGYARSHDGSVHMVFTVSPEHKKDFEALLAGVKEKYEKRYGCTYYIKFVLQSPETNIMAVDMENKPFLKEDGEPLFRPGGHGALLNNLNEIDADVIFIKNIDNVVKESLAKDTYRWKKVLMGRLIELREQSAVFLEQLRALSNNDICDNNSVIVRASRFLKDNFGTEMPRISADKFLVLLIKKLDRPMRVCGMVRNEGEPGGGPFIIAEKDGTTSLQILEAAQINKKDPEALKALESSTHFNPVDIVCSVKKPDGSKYDLFDYVDKTTGLISFKSYMGRKLKAQELPGLWNGSMSGWNTHFVEVPVSTFNPVKTVVDLLRPQHMED
jgi:hypothetical protein